MTAKNLKIAVPITVIFFLVLFAVFALYQKQTAQPQKSSNATRAAFSQGGFEIPPLTMVKGAKTIATQSDTGSKDIDPQTGIQIQNPQPNTLAVSPLEINGLANAQSGEISIIVKDANGNAIGTGRATACFAIKMCPFSSSVVFGNPTTKTGSIEIFSLTPQNGSKEFLQIIPVNF